MKFDFENLGPIKTGQVELGDLTVICGRNNVGKTYISHSIWGLLNQSRGHSITATDDLVETNVKALVTATDNAITQTMPDGPLITQSIDINLKQIKVSLKLQQHAATYSQSGLKATFNTDGDFFKNTSIKLSMFQAPNQNGVIEFALSEHQALYRQLLQQPVLLQAKNPKIFTFSVKKAANADVLQCQCRVEDAAWFESAPFTPERLLSGMINDWVKTAFFPNTRIITSERTGIALFLPNLDRKASEIARNLPQNTDADSLQQYLQSMKNESGAYPTYGDPIQDNIDRIRAAGSHKKESGLLRQNPLISTILSDLIGGAFTATAEGITFTSNENQTMPLHVVSSSAKSLFLIEHYIKREAKIGDLLIIDEPELNLHLDNQVKMAHLIAALINAGIKIMITTHSDHLLRELNNLMMLTSSNPRHPQFGLVEKSLLV